MKKMRVIDKLLMEKGMEEGRKITQVQASKELGIPVGSLHQYLTGITSGARSEDTFKRIAKYFNRELFELMAMIKEEYGAEQN